MGANGRDATGVMLAMVAGTGFILGMVVFFLGAVGGAADDALNLLFLVSAILFFGGIIGWFLRGQPFRHFDDINQPSEEEAH